MGKRGPQRRYRKDRPINSQDYSQLSFLLTTDRQKEAYDWLKSFTPKERGELFLLLYELWQEQQWRILDTALEVIK